MRMMVQNVIQSESIQRRKETQELKTASFSIRLFA
jgi:hypothetical protein